MNSNFMIKHQRTMLMLGGLWMALNAGAAYGLLPEASKPDRLTWLNAVMMVFHGGMVVVALMLPYLHSYFPSISLGRVAKYLSPLFFALLFYEVSYLWLHPAAKLGRDMLLMLILITILSHRDFLKVGVAFGYWCFFIKTYHELLEHLDLKNPVALAVGFFFACYPSTLNGFCHSLKN